MRRLLKDNKKGQAGLDLSRAFLIGLFALAVVGVMIVIVLTQLGNVTGTTNTAVVTNETHDNSTNEGLNSTANLTVDTFGTANGFTLVSIQAIYNTTANNGSVINSSNYTFVASTGLVYPTGADVAYPNVNISYTWSSYNNAGNTVNNVSAAIPTFFSNATTWLTLLSIVVIVLITIIIIRVFGGGGKETSL